MKYITLGILAFLIIMPAAFANNKSPYGIASAHPLATKAGISIIKQGGNAFDAAVAVTAALAVVEPYSSGLGGGGFWLLHTKHNNRSIMIDGREKAPLNSSKKMYLDKKDNFINKLAIEGALSSGIPGVPYALSHISGKYGRLPLSVTLKPAINLAINGYKIDSKYRLYAKLRLKALRNNPEASKIFLLNNNVPPENYILRQPDLAKTLLKITKSGAQGFYSGSVARQLVDGVKKGNGIWSLSDLEKYTIKERKPVSFKYKGVKITSAAPPSSGGIALAEMLGILELYKLNNLDKPTQKHIIIEAMRRAYADRATYLGDPDFNSIPVKKLISKTHAKQWKKDIDINEATPSEFISTPFSPAGNGTDTTHYSIIDNEGNMVSATLSINYPFGACFVPPGTGILLNDEMDDFSAKPGIPNAYGLIGAAENSIAPEKRPLSSMSPTFIESANKIAVVGTPGGSRIITMVLHAILDFTKGATATEIVTNRRFHHQYLPDMVMYEDNALTNSEVIKLTKMGHTLKKKMSPYGAGEGTYGNMQIVIIDKKKNTLSTASDPRGQGQAITGLK
ncbi:MAG: gamma-glutamyltransferase [Gammaproteobacteria bacterium]|nr:gamma-glutamyltransferase [Gammaproteobacteria bacterium]